MIAVEESQGAFARDLDFEQARVAAFLVEVIRIPDYLARSDACDHAVGVALTERHCALFIDNRYVAFDQLVDQIERQLQTAEARPKYRESLFVLTT